MNTRPILISLSALAAAMALSACESDYGHASAGRELNRDCRPGDTAAGTRSGEQCTSGSSTAAGCGDANVSGAGSAGSAPAQPTP